MQERLITTIDIGTSKIALTVAKVTDKGISIEYFVEKPSAGVKRSTIVKPDDVASVLKEAISEAETKLDVKITEACVSLPRYWTRECLVTAELDRSNPDECVSEEEIATLKSIAEDNLSLDPKEAVFALIPQSFDGEDSFQQCEDDIIGTIGSTIKGYYKAVIGHSRALSCIDRVMNKAGVSLIGSIFVPALQGACILSQDEMDGGVALVEVGFSTTSVSVFHKGVLRSYSSFPFGGFSISNDIKTEGAFSFRLADNIKQAFGSCIPERLGNMAEKPLQIDNNENGTSLKFDVKYLSEIITARYREVFDAVLFCIEKSGYARLLRCGIVLTGGEAAVANSTVLLKQMSGYNVRKGYIKRSKIVTSEYPSILEIGNTASIAMVAAASSLSITPNVTAVEPDSEPEPYADGTLFGKDEIETVEPVKKPRKILKFPKITGFIGETIGSLFDEANDGN